MRLGLYLPELPQKLAGLEAWEQSLDWPVELVSLYQAWDSPYGAFYRRELADINKAGRTALVTWEPWALPVPGRAPHQQPAFSLKTILAGKYDEYIWRWAKDSQSLGLPYLLRPMHEMNGNWYPWCGTVNENNPEDYAQVWRHLHEIFGAAGANQVSWVWSPYTVSFPGWRENDISCYYPGDAYADWIGLDGYNWGASQPWSRWQTFQEVFSSSYEAVTRLTQKPVLIAETASTEVGGDKSLWIRSALESLTMFFPRIEALVWFNVEKECDWRIQSSSHALHAFRQGLQMLSKRNQRCRSEAK